MARRIVITSGKGGVGKTTTTYILGYSLARLGHRVVLVDLDMGLGNLDLVAGVDARVNYDLGDILGQRCRVRQALVRSPSHPRLSILPCVNVAAPSKGSAQTLREIISELNDSCDYILMDCPAGIGFEFRRAIFCANEALILTTPHLIAIRDAGRVCNLLCGCMDNWGLVINRVREDFVAKKTMYSPREISQSLRVPLIGVLHENSSLAALSTTIGGLSSLREGDMSDWLELADNIAQNKKLDLEQKKFLDKRR